MEFVLFACHVCGDVQTYATLGELDNHRLEAHERPAPVEASQARLALGAGVIGRARRGTWARDETHWHIIRIQERDGAGLAVDRRPPAFTA